MFIAAYKAIGDLLSPDFRHVLAKALALTIAFFITVFVAVEFMLTFLTQFSWPWAEGVIAVGAGAALLAAFFFLMSPVAAAFAGFFLDDIANTIELKHYPSDVPGKPLPMAAALRITLQYFAIVLLVNLAVLPAVFSGIGAVALIAANAYLLSREYFEMVAMRHMPIEDVRILRKENAMPVFVAGLLPACLSLLPFANLALPLFATSYFTHFFKSVRASSP